MVAVNDSCIARLSSTSSVGPLVIPVIPGVRMIVSRKIVAIRSGAVPAATTSWIYGTPRSTS